MYFHFQAFFESFIIIIIIIIIILFREFFSPFDSFIPKLSYSKSPQASRTLLSILADLNKTVVLMISTHPLIFMSSRPGTKPLVTVPSTPVTICITITFMSRSFCNSLASFRYLNLFLLSFNIIVRSVGTAKFTIRQVLFFFFLTITSSGQLVNIS